MSKCLRKCLPKLELINEIKDKKLQMLVLKYFAKNKSFYQSLKEISMNIIKGNVRLSKYKKAKIVRHKKNIYAIAYNTKLSAKQKQRQVGQTGGWFWLIPTIVSLLK